MLRYTLLLHYLPCSDPKHPKQYQLAVPLSCLGRSPEPVQWYCTPGWPCLVCMPCLSICMLLVVPNMVNIIPGIGHNLLSLHVYDSNVSRLIIYLCAVCCGRTKACCMLWVSWLDKTCPVVAIRYLSISCALVFRLVAGLFLGAYPKQYALIVLILLCYFLALKPNSVFGGVRYSMITLFSRFTCPHYPLYRYKYLTIAGILSWFRVFCLDRIQLGLQYVLPGYSLFVCPDHFLHAPYYFIPCIYRSCNPCLYHNILSCNLHIHTNRLLVVLAAYN